MRKKTKKIKKNIKADDRLVRMAFSMVEVDREADWWDDLPVAVKKSILKAEKQLKEGKGVPHEVVMKKYKKWFTK
jgi:hypothetical protein